MVKVILLRKFRIREFEPQMRAQREQGLRRLASHAVLAQLLQ